MDTVARCRGLRFDGATIKWNAENRDRHGIALPRSEIGPCKIVIVSITFAVDFLHENVIF